MTDFVNSPKHYTSHPAGIEAIDVLRHSTDYDLGQAMKYLWRVMWGGKWDRVEDVEKAVWYLNDWLSRHRKSSGRTIDDDPYEESHLRR